MNHYDGIDLVGQDAWQKLVSRYGGTVMPVPASVEGGAGQRLVDLVGQPAAAALIQYAAGDTIYIAAGWERILSARYAVIKDMRQRGMSYEEIARSFQFSGCYTERNIRMILSPDREASIRAMDSFEQFPLL